MFKVYNTQKYQLQNQDLNTLHIRNSKTTSSVSNIITIANRDHLKKGKGNNNYIAMFECSPGLDNTCIQIIQAC